MHQLVDGYGLPLVVTITAGQASDSPMLVPLLADLQVARPTRSAATRPTRLARSAPTCATVASPQ